MTRLRPWLALPPIRTGPVVEMLVLDLDSGTAAHLCRVIEAYRRRLRTDGMALPEGLRQLLELTAPASSGQDRTEMGTTSNGLQDAPMAQLFTLDEVADRLKVGERTVRRYTSTGRLATVKLGAAVRVHSDDLVAFMDSLRSTERTAS